MPTDKPAAMAALGNLMASLMPAASDLDASGSDVRLWAGYREHRRSRQTGTLVVLVNSDEAGIDSSDGCAWTLVCDDHDQIISHKTRALARYFMASPLDWCEVCMAVADAEPVTPRK